MGQSFPLRCAFLFASTVCAAVSAGQVRYVDADAPALVHDGLTWFRAFVTLQDAIAVAQPGDEIRVAQGAYSPDRGAGQTLGSRLATFQLKSGVRLVGGYAGYGAPDANARDSAVYETILSGDLAGNDGTGDLGRYNDNSYHVVTYSDVQATGAVLDGFTVTAGNADGTGPPGTITNQGPAVHIRNDGFKCIPGGPTLRNCTFRDNRAAHHGAVNDHAFSTVIENCVFRNNFASEEGAGLLIHSGSATVVNTLFEANSCGLGGDGGGAWVSHDDDPSCSGALSQPTFIGCTFSNNFAGRGGGLWVGNASVTMIDTVLDGNTANAWGGAVYATAGAEVELQGCTMSNHTASINGGGVYLEDSSIVAADSIISGNAMAGVGTGAVGTGGALYLIRSSATMTDSRLENNLAYYGGAIYSDAGSRLDLTRCVIENNRAGLEQLGESSAGAGMYINESEVTLDQCSFLGNVASYYGGSFAQVDSTLTANDCTFRNARALAGSALVTDGGEAVFSRCSFLNNTSRDYTIIIHTNAGRVVYDTCSFVGNSAPVTAGLVQSGGEALFVRCLFADNATPQGSAGVACQDNAQVTVLNSTFRGNAGGSATGIYAFNNCNVTVVNSVLNALTSTTLASAIVVMNGDLTLINSTLVGNLLSGGEGGAVSISGAGSLATIRNSIFWGNQLAGQSSELAQIDLDSGASAVISNSCVQSWTGSLGGTNVVASDPMFIDAEGPDGVPGTADDDLRLSYSSPAINAGDESWLPADFADLDGDGDMTEPVPLDVLGQARVYDAGVDLGAYEATVIACPPGTFAANGQQPCTPCSPGTTQSAPGRTMCLPCACEDNNGCTENNCDAVTGACQFDVLCAVPTVSQWGLLILLLLIATCGTMTTARRGLGLASAGRRPGRTADHDSAAIGPQNEF